MPNSRPSYEDLLKEEEDLLKRLADRIVRTGATAGGAPIERDADPKVTTALRARLDEVKEQKKKLKESLDPVEATVYTVYESFLKQRGTE